MSYKDKKYDIEKEETELKQLINTITNDKTINDLSNTNDVGLLDELKSNTMVGDASSIKKILDEEKEIEKINETMEMDKSFYTASLGFTKRDFDELKDINHNIKKSNSFIIIILIILISLIIFGVMFFVLNK